MILIFGVKMNQHMAKVAITMDAGLLHRLDLLVEQRLFKSRSHAFQQLIQKEVSMLENSSLALECSKLDITAEQELADEGFDTELEQWPDY